MKLSDLFVASVNLNARSKQYSLKLESRDIDSLSKEELACWLELQTSIGEEISLDVTKNAAFSEELPENPGTNI